MTPLHETTSWDPSWKRVRRRVLVALHRRPRPSGELANDLDETYEDVVAVLRRLREDELLEVGQPLHLTLRGRAVARDLLSRKRSRYR